MSQSTPQEKRLRIKRKIRSRISGTALRPRLSVYRSNKAIYAQLIDDEKGSTILGGSSLKERKLKKMASAETLGKELARLAQEKGISTVVFDRGGQRYAGRIRALAEAARAGGLRF